MISTGGFFKIAMVATAALLAGCQASIEDLVPKAERAVPGKLATKMKAKSMAKGSPMIMRIFKKESTLEVWKAKTNGRYALLKTYEICKWSGQLGPKFKEGDRQAPEGFYNVKQWQMNPNSSYYLSFNMGFPNKFDRSRDRTGTYLMIHGACSSAGCYSMTDEQVAEIYAMARDTFMAGQKSFQIQAFPFRMTPENMFANRDNEHFAYWKMLKIGYDQFEATKLRPKVEVCGKNYQFNVATEDGQKFSARNACPALYMRQSTALAYTKIRNRDDQVFEKLLAKAEGRDARDLSSLGFGELLPGIQTVAATPVVSQNTGTTSTVSAGLPGVASHVKPKS